MFKTHHSGMYCVLFFTGEFLDNFHYCFPGGPGFCKDNLQGPVIGELAKETNVTVSITQPSYVETLICGNPAPVVTWKLDGQEITEGVTTELVTKDSGIVFFYLNLRRVEKILRITWKKKANQGFTELEI